MRRRPLPNRPGRWSPALHDLPRLAEQSPCQRPSASPANGLDLSHVRPSRASGNQGLSHHQGSGCTAFSGLGWAPQSCSDCQQVRSSRWLQKVEIEPPLLTMFGTEFLQGQHVAQTPGGLVVLQNIE